MTVAFDPFDPQVWKDPYPHSARKKGQDTQALDESFRAVSRASHRSVNQLAAAKE